MAVSAGYLTKIRRSIRRNSSTDVDAELTDIIEECRLDLISVGVVSAKATDEDDCLILGAVRCFARWKFGLSNEDAEKNKADYQDLKDELRRKRDYMSYAITFTVSAVVSGETVPIANAYITFNGETLQTATDGTAVFYYVAAGVVQEYTVEANGYKSTTPTINVTATGAVSVVLEAS